MLNDRQTAAEIARFLRGTVGRIGAAEFAGDAERSILEAAVVNGLSLADITWNRLPGAVGPGFRPSGGAMLNLLRLPF
ncbi:hypothetical protein ATY30_28510 [Sinorhizobium americanum]|nr:hypothetical protein CO664_24230 [Sinorhizobium sp. NG07B]POH24990.1 hypothetical protein ATY30_28510 [Sinorhizobium americanum]